MPICERGFLITSLEQTGPHSVERGEPDLTCAETSWQPLVCGGVSMGRKEERK